MCKDQIAALCKEQITSPGSTEMLMFTPEASFKLYKSPFSHLWVMICSCPGTPNSTSPIPVGFTVLSSL